ncbi:hypothetical protein JCM11641_008071 [Rhodosporidiobolus odoratus]
MSRNLLRFRSKPDGPRFPPLPTPDEVDGEVTKGKGPLTEIEQKELHRTKGPEIFADHSARAREGYGRYQDELTARAGRHKRTHGPHLGEGHDSAQDYQENARWAHFQDPELKKYLREYQPKHADEESKYNRDAYLEMRRLERTEGLVSEEEKEWAITQYEHALLDHARDLARAVLRDGGIPWSPRVPPSRDNSAPESCEPRLPNTLENVQKQLKIETAMDRVLVSQMFFIEELGHMKDDYRLAADAARKTSKVDEPLPFPDVGMAYRIAHGKANKLLPDDLHKKCDAEAPAPDRSPAYRYYGLIFSERILAQPLGEHHGDGKQRARASGLQNMKDALQQRYLWNFLNQGTRPPGHLEAQVSYNGSVQALEMIEEERKTQPYILQRKYDQFFGHPEAGQGPHPASHVPVERRPHEKGDGQRTLRNQKK